ncbi:GNAT family N-acetyltransferase [Paractinoplanes ovalisporus]|nr:GNAT family N-acetyltransferase [Actinoplanes ovalisporus]
MPVDAPGGGVHPGDLGWQTRFDGAEFLLWTVDDEPVAAGYSDGGVLRVTAAPGADRQALAADLAEGDDRAVDGVPMPGWGRDEERWSVMSWAPRAVESRAEAVDYASAGDRVLVQRASFANSIFTLDKWQRMHASPAAGLAVEMLVRTPSGEPAAAATGWFAGVGRCGLLEPVGTHEDHRGHGYGRDVVRGVCAALAGRGASAVAVVTPSANVGAVALYKSAGFTVLRENQDWLRPAA